MILLLAIHDGSDFLIYALGAASMLQAVNTLKMLQELSSEMYIKDASPGKIVVLLMPPERLDEFKEDGGKHIPTDAVIVGRANLYTTAQEFVLHMEDARQKNKKEAKNGS